MTAPNQRDLDNAACRAAIAQRQNEQWARVYAWALGKFGGGYEPTGRHFLIDKAEEDAARREGRAPEVAATVYAVKHTSGRRRYFTVDGGKVTEHTTSEEAFGPILKALHPSMTFEHGGKTYPALHYSLCWAPLDRYAPMTAEQLAALRESRERKKSERAEQKEREENPLFTVWAEKLRAEEERER